MITMKCPQCGEEITIDESREFAFCTYCGVKTEIKKPDSDSASAPTASSLMARAAIFLKENDFANAKAYYNKVLDINPHTSKAYWGLLMCNIRSMDFDKLSEKPQAIENCNEYSNALEHAESEEIRERYIAEAKKAQAYSDKLWAKREQVIREELSESLLKAKKALKIFRIFRKLSIVPPCLLTALVIIAPIVISVLSSLNNSMSGTTSSSPISLVLFGPVIIAFIFAPWIAGFSIAETIVNKSISSKEAKLESLNN